MTDFPRFLPAGDSALVVEFGDQVDPDLNAQVHALARALQSAPLPGVIECVPTYRSLLVHYDPLRLDLGRVSDWAQELLTRLDRAPPSARRIEVPVQYGGEAGPDLDWVAAHTGLTPPEVIRIHSGIEYRVYMMGFTPGYPYMGKLDPRLAVPRLDSPRGRVPAGSVGIAGRQTGIYSVESPGGWRLIGRTPLTLFDPLREPPFLFAPGDRVRFVPLNAESG